MVERDAPVDDLVERDVLDGCTVDEGRGWDQNFAVGTIEANSEGGRNMQVA